MTIKEVCKKYDITADTLRYYEKIGVIPNVNRTSGGIRDYLDEDIQWVENALCLRKSGLSVEAIAEYVRLYLEGDSTFKERQDLLVKQREELLREMHQLEETLERLNYKISKYDEAIATGKLTW